MLLRIAHDREGVAQFLRGLAEHDGARELGVVAARAVVLDQQRHVVAALHDAALVMASAQDRGLAERRRRAAEQALLAAEQFALVLRERGEVAVAHAGLDRGHHLGPLRVLHGGGAADQRDFLGALDRLDAVDEVGGVDEGGARHLLLDHAHEVVLQPAAPEPADGLVAAALELLRDQRGVVVVGVVDREERRAVDRTRRRRD